MNIRSLYWHSILVGYVLVGSFIILWIRIRHRHPVRRQENLYRLEKHWARTLFRASGSQLTVQGEEFLNPHHSYIFYANHQSSFDIFTLFAFTPVPIVFLSKPLYFKIPIFGWAMREMGHFSINRLDRRKALQDFKRVRQALREQNRSLIIFPEGTRSLTGEIKPFKISTLRALAADSSDTAPLPQKQDNPTPATLQIVPTTLIDTRTVQRKGSLRIFPGKATLVFSKPIPFSASHLSPAEKAQLMQTIETTVRKTYAQYSPKNTTSA